MITLAKVRVRRGNEPDDREHAVFDIDAGAPAGTLVQRDYTTITTGNNGLENSKWKLADGTNGRVYLLEHEVLANTYTALPLEEELRQETTIQAPILNNDVGGTRALAGWHEIVEFEGTASSSTYFKSDSGDGQITASTTKGTILTCASGKLAVRTGTLATGARVARLLGFAPAESGESGAFRIVVEFFRDPLTDAIE